MSLITCNHKFRLINRIRPQKSVKTVGNRLLQVFDFCSERKMILFFGLCLIYFVLFAYRFVYRRCIIAK